MALRANNEAIKKALDHRNSFLLVGDQLDELKQKFVKVSASVAAVRSRREKKRVAKFIPISCIYWFCLLKLCPIKNINRLIHPSIHPEPPPPLSFTCKQQIIFFVLFSVCNKKIMLLSNWKSTHFWWWWWVIHPSRLRTFHFMRIF